MTKKQDKNMKSNFRKRFLQVFWGLFAAGLVAVVLVFAGIAWGWFGYMPPIAELQNPKNKYATEVFSSDMVSLGSYYKKENRVGVQ